MRTFLFVVVAGGAIAAGYQLAPGTAADPGLARTGNPVSVAVPAAPVPPPGPRQTLVAHEWGTFTSFSGSDGVPMSFSPNNTDLPNFVFYPGRNSKGGRLLRGGLVSMETPVIYFYTDRETNVSVNVDFPKGWITEWYPFAHDVPKDTDRNDRTGGQSIRWQAKLIPNTPVRFPHARGNTENHYYFARETDSVPVQVEVTGRSDDDDEFANEYALHGGTVVQREKFLFYRGVGTFPPPVTVRALGGDKARVTNSAGGPATGLVLVTVREGKVGFRPLGDLAPGASSEAQLPVAGDERGELAAFLVKELTAAGLYEKEAKAMVKTWDSAWFGEEGTRLLYLVSRTRTDDLLPLTMDPTPTELVRVLVGRHDFLTPEVEAVAEQQLRRYRAAQAEAAAATGELARIGRFTGQAQAIAAKRLDANAPQK